MDISEKRKGKTEFIGLCPKCGTLGITRGSDRWGTYLECFYCGYLEDLELKKKEVLLDGERAEATGDSGGILT